MLRHIGHKRTFKHNVRLAVLLCFTAGSVNAIGLLSLGVFTTNITGYAGTLAMDVASGQWQAAAIAAAFLLLFLLGAIFSSLYISLMGRRRQFAYTVPLFVELSVLLTVALLGSMTEGKMEVTAYLAGALLFAMGLQNALVSMISGAVVRTTHLTGMVTDFGIAISEFIKSRFVADERLRQRLFMQANIIFFFLVGGILGAILYFQVQYQAFFLPIATIILTIFYDVLRVRILRATQQYIFKQRNK